MVQCGGYLVNPSQDVVENRHTLPYGQQNQALFGLDYPDGNVLR